MWKSKTWWSYPVPPHFSPCAPSHIFFWRRPWITASWNHFSYFNPLINCAKGVFRCQMSSYDVTQTINHDICCTFRSHRAHTSTIKVVPSSLQAAPFVVNEVLMIGQWQHSGWYFHLHPFTQPFKSRVRHSSCWNLQHRNSPAVWARELFKLSTDSGSLVDSKKIWASKDAESCSFD